MGSGIISGRFPIWGLPGVGLLLGELVMVVLLGLLKVSNGSLLGEVGGGRCRLCYLKWMSLLGLFDLVSMWYCGGRGFLHAFLRYVSFVCRFFTLCAFPHFLQVSGDCSFEEMECLVLFVWTDLFLGVLVAVGVVLLHFAMSTIKLAYIGHWLFRSH